MRRSAKAATVELERTTICGKDRQSGLKAAPLPQAEAHRRREPLRAGLAARRIARAKASTGALPSPEQLQPTVSCRPPPLASPPPSPPASLPPPAPEPPPAAPPPPMPDPPPVAPPAPP